MNQNLPVDKGGRPRKIQDAEELRDNFMAYIEDCAENPIKKPQMLANGKQVDLEYPRPWTLDGFRLFLDIDTATWNGWRKHREDLIPTIAKVEMAIRDHKYCGAAVGLYNHSIIARDLGLTDRHAVDVTPVEPPPRPPNQNVVANCVHPDDPNPTGPNRPLFTPEQIAQGIPFYEPQKPG